MQDSRSYIDHYHLVRSLGKGGMGEVLLAYDPICSREVALKRVREDMKHSKGMQNRFLREAKIAAQLAHPSIIPIYSIVQGKELSYYTMPYIAGETLRSIVRTSYQQERQGEILHPIGASIPTLCRIFLTVCQAVRYAHSKGVLHRDLKPENIIVGKYGEVIILDWGLAECMQGPKEQEEDEVLPELHADLTHPGKIPGTITYMAPERALGEEASFQTDIYSLGVMLYQLLTLQLPFQRTSLQEYKKRMQYEIIPDPTEIAPYRDIPLQLADSVKKCLCFEKSGRYHHIEELIADLENYIEGRPQWVESARLKVETKSDWRFQEHVLLAKHMAIASLADVMEWVGLMISKNPFSGNVKLETNVLLGENSRGIGFLLSASPTALKKGVEEGDCLWIGSKSYPGASLFRSGVKVMHTSECGLNPLQKHKISIEKRERTLRCFIDDILVLNYISQMPPSFGGHIGVLHRDGDFRMEEITISVSSQDIVASCLAVPDAFLAHRDYKKAVSEYRRIASAFPGRAEGREALFRSGVAFLEEGLASKKKKEKEELLNAAEEEFSKLRYTPGAPLEYLGKSLAYQAAQDVEEEIKCLELALCKYKKHPLLPVLKEHILFRLHETSHHDRNAAYHFTLLCLRRLPHLFSSPDNRRLLESLEKHLEPLPFLEKISTPSLHIQELSIALAFWKASPFLLDQILEHVEDPALRNNALFCLLELGALDPKYSLSEEVKSALPGEIPITWRALRVHALRALDQKKGEKLFALVKEISFPLTGFEKFEVDALLIWAYLQESNWKEAEKLLEAHAGLSSVESSPFYVLLTCFLWHTEGEEIALIHAAGVSDASFPRTSTLLCHYLLGNIDLTGSWYKKAFSFEKQQLFRQLALFYHCTKDKEKEALFYKKLKHLKT